MTFGSLGTGMGMDNYNPKVREGEGNEKKIPKIREWEGNEKRAFLKFGNGKGMKKSIPTFREREPEAIIPAGNGNGKKQINDMTEKTGPFYQIHYKLCLYKGVCNSN